jgi:predicted DNA-binding transcriptional regulator AlpA
MSTVLTISDLAGILKMKPSQIQTMCRARSRARMEFPIPVLKLNGNTRFLLADIEAWLQKTKTS